MTVSPWQARQWLDSLGPVWGVPATGDPGDLGADNLVDVPRQQITFNAADGRSRESSAPVEWPDFPEAADVTHVAFFTAETGGDYRGAGTVQASGGDTVAAGTPYRAEAGDIVWEVL